MSRWEYSKIDLNDGARRTEDIDLLKGAGAQGWELVIITANHFAYLKREIEEPAAPKAPRRKAAS